MKNGEDRLEKLVACKGVDFTLNPSFPGSYVTEVMDDEGNVVSSLLGEKSFSEVEAEDKFDGYKVKTFSNLNELGLEINTPKTSKINNQFINFADSTSPHIIPTPAIPKIIIL